MVSETRGLSYQVRRVACAAEMTNSFLRRVPRHMCSLEMSMSSIASRRSIAAWINLTLLTRAVLIDLGRFDALSIHVLLPV